MIGTFFSGTADNSIGRKTAREPAKSPLRRTLRVRVVLWCAIMKLTDADKSRFALKVNKDGPIQFHCRDIGQCWIWTGGIQPDKGYGWFYANCEAESSHRVAWQIENGEIPDGLYVLHKCDNPPCCNPSHLFLGTGADNMADKVKKGRCQKGSQQSQAKLTEADIPGIRKLLRTGATPSWISRLFEVTSAAIGNIRDGKRWRHVP